MKRIVFTYGIGYGRHSASVEVDDNATEDAIEEIVKDAVFERLDWSWKVDGEE